MVSPGLRRAFLVGLLAPAVLLVVNMVRAAPLTIDDAYITYRYARNLVRGFGLVYNPGERIEGYTNFLWTLLVAGGLKLRLDPNVVTKVLGGASALGTLAIVWLLALRLQPLRRLPPVAPWLLASSATFAGWAVAGLETSFFVFLLLLGTWRLLVERDDPARFPWSGLVYALAGLTRPEAPLYLGVAVLALGRGVVARQNLIRIAIFVAIVGAHLLWRHAYYGAWFANTVHAKTGALGAQVRGGLDYVWRYLAATGPVLLFGAVGAILAIRRRTWLGLVVALTAVATAASVILVGGDWMPLWRFLVPFEAFAFLLVDVAFRSAAEATPDAPLPVPLSAAGRQLRGVAWVALALFAAGEVAGRGALLRTQLGVLAVEQKGWDDSAHPVAAWLAQRGQPGLLALGDIGYVGWSTDYPIVDILGLVDPMISALPGGYGNKQGPRYLDYFFSRSPDYFVLISAHDDCDHPFHPSIAAVYRDPARRFQGNYRALHRVAVGGPFGWCVYGRTPPETRARPLYDFESGFAGWEATGDAFQPGPSDAARPGQQMLSGMGGARLANSFHPTLGDGAIGTLLSPPFTVDREHLSLFVGGGASPATRVELLVDGQEAFHVSGTESEDLRGCTGTSARSPAGAPASASSTRSAAPGGTSSSTTCVSSTAVEAASPFGHAADPAVDRLANAVARGVGTTPARATCAPGLGVANECPHVERRRTFAAGAPVGAAGAPDAPDGRGGGRRQPCALGGASARSDGDPGRERLRAGAVAGCAVVRRLHAAG